jgi:hypothetical protein
LADISVGNKIFIKPGMPGGPVAISAPVQNFKALTQVFKPNAA